MLKRSIFALVAASACIAYPALAAPPEPVRRVELSAMMGRWYEVARLPNKTQKDCQAGTSDWTRAGEGFAVVQACNRGAVDGPLAQWRARAQVADPETNAKFKMSFFGGLVSQEYWVLEHRPEQGWLILSTANGKYLWLMSQRPTLAAPVRAQAIARIRALGFDPGRLEFPLPARS
jgi:apolipoprotein D and lipocalin family protein